MIVGIEIAEKERMRMKHTAIKRIAAIVAILLLFTPLSHAESTPETPATLYDEALAAYQAQDYATAVAQAQQAIELGGTGVAYRELLAWAQYYAGDYTAALDAFAAYAAAAPTLLDPCRGMVLCYYSLGQYGYAVDVLVAYLDVLPEEAAFLYQQIGQIYYNAGEYATSIEAFELSLQADPAYIDSITTIGLAYYKLGMVEEALVHAKERLRLTPGESVLHMDVAFLAGLVGDYDTAIAEYTAAYELDPERTGALHGRAEAHYELGEYVAAEADITAYLALDPENTTAQQLLDAIKIANKPPPMALVTSNGLVNVRSEGSTKGELVGTLSPGSEVPVLGEAETGWYEVQLPDGQTGFVSPRLVRIMGE